MLESFQTFSKEWKKAMHSIEKKYVKNYIPSVNGTIKKDFNLSKLALLRADPMTIQPSIINLSHKALPIPELAPVTHAICLLLTITLTIHCERGDKEGTSRWEAVIPDARACLNPSTRQIIK